MKIWACRHRASRGSGQACSSPWLGKLSPLKGERACSGVVDACLTYRGCDMTV